MNITGNTMREAIAYVDECAKVCPELHTVTFEINGQHGGVDLVIKGITGESVGDMENYERKFVIHA